ncbi:glycosyltransferase family 4 protein [Paenibacillus sp. UMB4589-SE434]|uniref:glycosyltransferase family 4 protein n=1 Tax=Paenibacillus sp. UMB4589-SE434 TaxID=3046314 RepID=UPI00254CE6CC|nr:glycosyltransferase family 4 protein [Paenibacillus sp. UMB4589-SE434]MDK8181196.1 glycosyltransferase family 4 protein [Paenibacillus sp. UMB4589-SE434]
MIQIIWQGNMFDSTGYAKASRQYVLALHESGVNVKVEAFSSNMPEVVLPPEQQQILKHLAAKRKAPGKKIYLYHYIPDMWKRKLQATIGFTYWETSRLPDEWVSASNQMNALFLPSSNNMEVFRTSGVRVPMFHIRPCLHYPLHSFRAEDVPSYLHQLPPFRFLAVCSWIERKGYDLLLKAFMQEFSAAEPVSLVIKTAGNHDIYNVLQNMKHTERLSHEPAPIYVDLHTRSEMEMDALYRNCHVFVHPSRGEGVGYPMLEAAVRGLPIITTGWGGHMDFLNEHNSYLIPFQLVPVKPQPYYYGYKSNQLWAEASVEQLRVLMRQVLNDYQSASLKGLAAQQAATTHFTPKAAAQDMIHALQTLSGYKLN